jgi:hypothetical protein
MELVSDIEPVSQGRTLARPVGIGSGSGEGQGGPDPDPIPTGPAEVLP